MEESHEPLEEPRELPEPNPVTRAAHRKDFRRQVLLPFLLVVLLSIALVVVFVIFEIGGKGDNWTTTWSEVSTIFLSLFWFLICLVFLALVAALLYGVTKLLKLLPPYTRMAQEGIETVKPGNPEGSNRLRFATLRRRCGRSGHSPHSCVGPAHQGVGV